MATLRQPILRQSAVLAALAWCLPSLLGFVLFLFSFPIDRTIPFWPQLNLAELYFFWFLFVTPVTTVVAFVRFIKRKRTSRIALLHSVLAWTMLIASVLANLFMLVGLAASFS